MGSAWSHGENRLISNLALIYYIDYVYYQLTKYAHWSTRYLIWDNNQYLPAEIAVLQTILRT